MNYPSDQSRNESPPLLEQAGLPSSSKTPTLSEQSKTSETSSATPPATRTKAGTFAPGNGFGQGRRKGSKNKSTILREKLEKKNTKMLTKEVPEVLMKALELAKAGDKQAMKLVLDEVHRLHTRAADNAGTGLVQVLINIGTLNEENMGDILAGEYKRES